MIIDAGLRFLLVLLVATGPVWGPAARAGVAEAPGQSDRIVSPADVTVTRVEVVVPTVGAPDVGPAPASAQEDPEVLGSDDAGELVAEAAPLVADAVTGGGAADPVSRLVTGVLETDGFQTLGVTWPQDAEGSALDPRVRTRSADGVWTDWVTLEEGDGAPDTGTPDAGPERRGGTESMWVGEAAAVQVSFAAGAGDRRVELDLVDVPAGPAMTVTGAVSVRSGERATAAVGAPTVVVTGSAPRVISREEWGARPPACQPDVAQTLVGAVVHHTAGSNDYADVAQAMQQIRGDQAYHIDGRGWCDIGYNFIVDKWGNVYEGRDGSLTSPVIGVHAGGFNTGTIGVSMLGDYSTLAPPPAAQEAVAQIVAWRLAAYDRDPSATMTYRTPGGENSRYAAGAEVRLPVVFAHRDVSLTACPGTAGYQTLPALRTRATALAVSGPLVAALYQDMLGRDVDPTGLAGWTQALSSGMSAGRLATLVALSEEYATTAVRQAYLDVLRREPDAGGLRNWVNAVMGGMLRPEDLRGALIASEEYYLIAGSTPVGYVTRLYQDILRRDPQAAEVASWVAELASGGRGVVSRGVWASLESSRLRVDDAYRLFLGRSADPTGLSGWAPVLQTDGENALRTVIVDSDEYRSRALTRF